MFIRPTVLRPNGCSLTGNIECPFMVKRASILREGELRRWQELKGDLRPGEEGIRFYVWPRVFILIAGVGIGALSKRLRGPCIICTSPVVFSNGI